MKYSIVKLVICFMVGYVFSSCNLVHNTNSQKLTHPSINGIIDIERIGGSIIYLSDYVDGNEDYKGIYRLDLNNNKVSLIFSQKFDGRYLSIIKNSDTSFTVEVEYEYETELFNHLFSENGEKHRMSLKTLKALENKVDLNEKYMEGLMERFGGNIWKSSRIKEDLILLSINKYDDDRYYLLSQSANSKSIDTLLESNKIIPFCVDEKYLYSIIDMKLQRYTIDSIGTQDSVD